MVADVLPNALHAVAVPFTIIAAGMALRACGIISPVGQREMGQVSTRLLLPAVNFSALVADVSWRKLVDCRVAAAFAGVHVLVGIVLGVLLCWIGGGGSRFLREHTLQVLVICSFCNGTSMPFPLFRALLGAPQLQRGVESEGFLALTVYGVVWRLLLWTVGIALLQADAAARTKRPVSVSALLRAAVFNSNTVAAAAGFAIALGGLRDTIFFGPFAFVREALEHIGKAAHPTLLLTLGAALWPIPSSFDWKAIFGVCVVKLVGLPVVTMAFLSFTGMWSVRGVVLMIESCVPSAMQVSMMVQSVGGDARPALVICFWQHLAALVTMTTCLSIVLTCLP